MAPSDLSIKTTYELVNISKAIHGEQRLSISGKEVRDKSGGKALGFYKFSSRLSPPKLVEHLH